MSDDTELLRQYVDEGSDAAFRALVERHLNLVYSAACAELGATPISRTRRRRTCLPPWPGKPGAYGTTLPSAAGFTKVPALPPPGLFAPRSGGRLVNWRLEPCPNFSLIPPR